MIRKFKFNNFQSFLNETEVSFLVNNKATDSYYDVSFVSGDKVSQILGVFGANGAGKSSLLKPLAFVSWFVKSSFKSLERGEAIPFHSHFSAKDKPTNIEIEFETDIEFSEEEKFKNIYKYVLSFDKKRVYQEELKVKTSRLFTNVFKRVYENGKYEVKTNPKYIENKLHSFEEIPENCSLISYLGRFNIEETTPKDFKPCIVDMVYFFFSFNLHNLTQSDKTDFSQNHYFATQEYNDDPELFEKVKSLIRRFDLGVVDIEIRTMAVVNEDGDEFERLVPYFIHKMGEELYELPIYRISRGTKSAYCLLSHIFEALRFGSLAILDEFDNDIHPLLTAEIIELFQSPNNSNGAQLFFTSHNLELLKILRKQHVMFVEKDDSVSDTWRADQITGLKERDNLYQKYLSGSLGAVPDIE